MRVKKPLSSQCLRIKWQDTTGHAIPSFFFFQIQKQKTCRQSSLIEKLWMTSTNWSVWQRPSAVPYFIIFFFFFKSFSPFFSSHTHTLVKFVADRFSPSPTMQLTSRKQHLLLQYVHTHVFLSNNIKEEQGKNDSHPEREKKQVKKRKKYKYLCPAVTLHKWKKDWHWIQKYHNFYISNCLCWLLFRNTLISQEELVSRENLYF